MMMQVLFPKEAGLEQKLTSAVYSGNNDNQDSVYFSVYLSFQIPVTGSLLKRSSERRSAENIQGNNTGNRKTTLRSIANLRCLTVFCSSIFP